MWPLNPRNYLCCTFTDVEVWSFRPITHEALVNLSTTNRTPGRFLGSLSLFPQRTPNPTIPPCHNWSIPSSDTRPEGPIDMLSQPLSHILPRWCSKLHPFGTHHWVPKVDQKCGQTLPQSGSPITSNRRTSRPPHALDIIGIISPKILNWSNSNN